MRMKKIDKSFYEVNDEKPKGEPSHIVAKVKDNILFIPLELEIIGFAYQK